MRFIVIRMALAWGAMIIEQSRPDVLPAGAVLLPVVIAGMLWTRNAGGIVAGGIVLIVDWIARRQGLPLLPVVLTFGATVMLIQRTSDDLWTGKRTFRLKTPEWAQPTVLTIIGVGLTTGPAVIAQHTVLTHALPVIATHAMISLPLTLLLTGLMILANEFGLRRTV